MDPSRPRRPQQRSAAMHAFNSRDTPTLLDPAQQANYHFPKSAVRGIRFGDENDEVRGRRPHSYSRPSTSKGRRALSAGAAVGVGAASAGGAAERSRRWGGLARGLCRRRSRPSRAAELHARRAASGGRRRGQARAPRARRPPCRPVRSPRGTGVGSTSIVTTRPSSPRPQRGEHLVGHHRRESSPSTEPSPTPARAGALPTGRSVLAISERR